MTSLSPGTLVGAFELMRLIGLCPTPLHLLPASYSTLGGVDIKHVLSTVQNLNWVQADSLGNATLTSRGLELMSLNSRELQIRTALLHYISVERPTWLQLAVHGRLRVRAFAGSALAQIMDEGGLITSDDPDVVKFWDDLAARARGLQSDRQLEIGREGERLSIDHERRRTRLEPRWVSLDSNSDGYDILSSVSRTDNRPLSIEVKTTAQQSAGHLFITSNEWLRAIEADAHVFHLWNIGGSLPELRVVSVEEIEKHIPNNRGAGAWESTKISFSQFA